ncbi:MAG: hypothetical protein JJ908_10470 [Rhizobiales bacterium]|nr:hypothetical protein [Hyphomicrobiales bacterium]MBO6699244.1 hypothetical protein [Hyphomicrobiales bacterium]MBO6736782.1 hypothetical protein [Hyphomicrobiales bacterium]MBO6912144.1 hypothetical protein [Hyphomicrobiales bacterium]MBO6956978.1 hypothetical protein [Hyphomicrobiales bacterium]
MSDYNYDSFSPDNYNLQSADGPEVGEKAPNFSLETYEGKRRNLLDFEGECLVLELGSITCPLFLTRHESMKDIAKGYPMPYSMYEKLTPVQKFLPILKWMRKKPSPVD